MGRLVKGIFAGGIIIILIVFLVLGITSVNSLDAKISALENQANLIEKKKQSVIEQALSLEAVKQNLTIQIAMENNNSLAAELQKNLTDIEKAQAQANLLEQQKAAQAQAQAAADAAAQQAILLQQAQAAAQATQVVRRVSTPVRTRAS